MTIVLWTSSERYQAFCSFRASSAWSSSTDRRYQVASSNTKQFPNYLFLIMAAHSFRCRLLLLWRHMRFDDLYHIVMPWLQQLMVGFFSVIKAGSRTVVLLMISTGHFMHCRNFCYQSVDLQTVVNVRLDPMIMSRILDQLEPVNNNLEPE